MKRVVVVIPVHKPEPTVNELASLRQCYKILGKHPIRIIAPAGLDMSRYREVAPQCEVMFIDPVWLSSIQQYNKLKISKYFYNQFKDYEYLLTYELDAWVFRDELLYWCDKEYDFIGAPWFEGYTDIKSENVVPGANSGFSLRKVRSTRNIVSRIERLKKIRNFWYKSKFQGIVRFERLIKLKLSLFKIKDTANPNYLLHGHWSHNEDYLLSSLAPSVFNDYQTAPFVDAMRFSFEGRPSLLFEQNRNKLPFGCHAWEKYEPEFWQSYIQ